MAGLGDNLSLYYALNGYVVIEKDEDTAATKQYYQYMNRLGEYYIMRQEIISSTLTEYKFFRGSSDYATNWTNRDSLSYGFPDNVFKDMQ